MYAHARVFDHPYSTVTDKNGYFKLTKIPAGKLNVLIWRRQSGWYGGEEANGCDFTVRPGATLDIGKQYLKEWNRAGTTMRPGETPKQQYPDAAR